MTRARMLLLSAGALSVMLAMLHFATRTRLPADPTVRAAWDLVGLSMMFAGLVTITVAWMALSAALLAGYGALYGVFYAGHAWVLLFAGPDNWFRAVAALALAVAALAAAWFAWIDRFEGPTQKPD